jgi:aryl-alcohol dehydrogenase-like predicted oxidoreductase
MFSQSLITHPEDVLGLVRRQGLGALVRGAFEYGRLTGKYFRTPPRFSADDIRSRALKAEEFERYSTYEGLIPAGGDMVSLALRYLLDFETTHTIVLGAKSVAEYRGASGALTLPRLGEDVHARIRTMRDQLTDAGARAPSGVLGLLRRLGARVSARLRSLGPSE